MPTCEISGKQVEKTIAIKVEGTVMNVAPEHAHMGERVFTAEDTPKRKIVKKSTTRRVISQEKALQLKQHFGKLLQQARQKKGWTQEELGKQLHEKVSVIQHIEHEKIHPSEKLAHKIKQLLHIELYETVDEDDAEYEHVDVGKPQTLGEMLQAAMKKGK